ncbi:Spermatogenesis-associated 5 [Olea europaea subsp. europaea]|uniref:Spermatogenesis-associated 5 n=1 Tax=Olea europaea subsp. europaea TaxID=158383 RepID=A0A8S0TME5_OLEEU|nr:Spermatogenesis-associated 5 [Olea europaea subsp. europaea]
MTQIDVISSILNIVTMTDLSQTDGRLEIVVWKQGSPLRGRMLYGERFTCQATFMMHTSEDKPVLPCSNEAFVLVTDLETGYKQYQCCQHAKQYIFGFINCRTKYDLHLYNVSVWSISGEYMNNNTMVLRANNNNDKLRSLEAKIDKDNRALVQATMQRNPFALKRQTFEDVRARRVPMLWEAHLLLCRRRCYYYYLSKREKSCGIIENIQQRKKGKFTDFDNNVRLEYFAVMSTVSSHLWGNLLPMVNEFSLKLNRAISMDIGGQTMDALKMYKQSVDILIQCMSLCQLAYEKIGTDPINAQTVSRLVGQRALVVPVTPNESIGKLVLLMRKRFNEIYLRVRSLHEFVTNRAHETIDQLERIEMATNSLPTITTDDAGGIAAVVLNATPPPTDVTFATIIGQSKAIEALSSIVDDLTTISVNQKRSTERRSTVVEWVAALEDALVDMIVKVTDEDTVSTVLMAGPPGTGKTTLAYAFYNELKMRFTELGVQTPTRFVPLDGSKFFNSMFGETERAIRTFVEAVREARRSAIVVVFFDEIDVLMVERSPGKSEVSQTENRAVTAFFMGLDTLRGDGKITANGDAINRLVLISATNHFNSLDEAFVRRVGPVIAVDVPSSFYEYMKVAVHWATKFGFSYVVAYTENDVTQCEQLCNILAANEKTKVVRISQADVERAVYAQNNLLKELNNAIIFDQFIVVDAISLLLKQQQPISEYNFFQIGQHREKLNEVKYFIRPNNTRICLFESDLQQQQWQIVNVPTVVDVVQQMSIWPIDLVRVFKKLIKEKFINAGLTIK